MKYFYDYEAWEETVRELGAWVHCHYNYVVADDPDSDFCFGGVGLY